MSTPSPAESENTRRTQIFEADSAGIQTLEANHNADHYVWIALAQLFVGQRNQGAGYLGDFPNETLPAKTPVKIVSTKAYDKFELAAISLETMNSAFDKTLPDPEQKNPNSRVSHNSAFSLAQFLKKEFKGYGVAILDDLTGESKVDVQNLFDLIFKPEAMDKLYSTREIENILFEGIFLDAIRQYLKFDARKNLNKVGLTNAVKDVAKSVIGKLEAAVEEAWRFANEHLNETEDLIRARQNGRPGKDWYETPDSRFPNAPLPLDLVCLAETGRVPLDLRNLEASKVMTEGVAGAVVQGIREANENNALAKMEQMMREQEARHQAQMDELMKKIGAKTE